MTVPYPSALDLARQNAWNAVHALDTEVATLKARQAAIPALINAATIAGNETTRAALRLERTQNSERLDVLPTLHAAAVATLRDAFQAYALGMKEYMRPLVQSADSDVTAQQDAIKQAEADLWTKIRVRDLRSRVFHSADGIQQRTSEMSEDDLMGFAAGSMAVPA